MYSLMVNKTIEIIKRCAIEVLREKGLSKEESISSFIGLC